MKPILFAFPGNEAASRPLALALEADMGAFEIRQFPDGESYIRVDSNIRSRTVIVVCTLDRPNEKLTPLLFFAATARDLGARAVYLVCPYLAYMRQDKRFRPGEGITSRYFADLIANAFSGIITIDPHLHRYPSLDALYRVPAVSLHAAGLLSDWIKTHVEEPLLIGPDSESEQWVSEVARLAGAPSIVLEKTRRGDRDVTVTVPHVERWASHSPVLVDDIVSTARTMIATVGHLTNAGMLPPVCIGVHGIFADGAYEDLLAAGVDRVVTCNTIAHPSNGIDVTDLLAGGIRSMCDLQ